MLEWVVDELMPKEATLTIAQGLACRIEYVKQIRPLDVFSGTANRGVVVVEAVTEDGALLVKPHTHCYREVVDLYGDYEGPVPVYGEAYQDEYGFWQSDIVGYQDEPAYGWRPGEGLVYVGPMYAEAAA